MTELNSKMSVASATAAQMSQAANTLSAIQAPSIASGQTTVTGNTNAQQTIKQTAEALTTIVAAFNADIGKNYNSCQRVCSSGCRTGGSLQRV